jgi:uncharacterized protein
MKALLMLLVVLAGVWLWRNRSTSDKKVAPPKATARAAPLDMVRCAQCGMHIPGNEAVAGHQGVYCSADHLRQAES